MKNIIQWIFSITLIVPSTLSAFESELSMGEGIPRYEFLVERVVLRSSPFDLDKKGKNHTVGANRLLKYDKYLARVLKTGRITATKKGEVIGRNLGPISRLTADNYYSKGKTGWIKIKYSPGDEFEYLIYRAEGHHIIRIKEDVWEFNSNPFDNWKEYKLEEWVRLLSPAGKPLGWLKLVEGQVKLVGASF